MKSPARFFDKKQVGFTLVELLIAITVLSALVGTGLTSFRNAQAKARDAKRKAEIKQISHALALYYADHGNFDAILGTEAAPLDGRPGWLAGQRFMQAYYYSTPTVPSCAACHNWSTLLTRLQGYADFLPVDPKNQFSNWNNGTGMPTAGANLSPGYYWVGLASRTIPPSSPVNVIVQQPVCYGQTIGISYFVEAPMELMNDPQTNYKKYPPPNGYFGCVTGEPRRLVDYWGPL